MIQSQKLKKLHLNVGVLACVVLFISIFNNKNIVYASTATVTATVTPGTISGSTQLTLTPINPDDTFEYVTSTSAIGSLPEIGSTAPTGTTYTSGANITGIDPTTNKYLDVYEVSETNVVQAFTEITLTASDITAPTFTIAPTVAPRTVAGSTQLTLTPINPSDTLEYVIGASAIGSLPVIGSTSPGGTSFTSGANITGVDPTTNKYLDIYEVSGANVVQAFTEIILTANDITVPTFATAPTVAPGTMTGSTKLILTPMNPSDTLKYIVGNSAIGSLPVIGSTAPAGTLYASGRNIPGVEPITNKYIDVYEVSGTNVVQAFTEIILTDSDITVPTFTSAPSVSPGTIAGSTKLTLAPINSSDTLEYVIGASTIGSLPVIGSTAPGGTSFTSGANITGVDPTTNKYLDVYEVSGTNIVQAFIEITLTANNITAPAMVSTPTAAPGTTAGSTKLNLTASTSGDTFKINVVSKATSLPTMGNSPAGKVYIYGSDITGVDPTTNKYVDVYELDSNSKFANFFEITLTASEITVPTFKISPIVVKGSAAGTTKLTLTPNTKNDTFQYIISSSAIGTLPVIGSTISSGTAYTSGTDIEGGDPITNKYLDIYELDSNGNVASFSEIALTANSIAAPAIVSTPSAAPGTAAGTTKLTLTASTSGDTFKVNVVSKVTVLPVIGSTPAGKAYTSGSDITGVDPTTNKYVDVYELDSNGKVANFSEITLLASNITAPTFKIAPIVVKGSAAGTTKLTLTPNTKNDTFEYVISSSAIGTLPVIGSTVSSGTAYTSGTDITGVDSTIKKYLDIYELDSNGNVANFSEITLTENQITAPAMVSAPTAAPGTAAGTTKLTLTASTSGDTFKVNVVSKATVLPVIRSTPVGKAYTSGTNITGVNPTTNKYVDVYELDSTGKVANFSEITLVASNITAPTFKTASIVAKGSAAGTTKLTLTPNTKNDTFQFIISSSPIGTLPAIGSTISLGTTYTSGTDITGVDPTTNKYVDVYELDSNGQVVNFSEITLTSNKITAPAMVSAPTAAPGTVAGSTKLTLTASTLGDTFKVNVVSKAIVLPVIGSTPSGKTYTSGSNITGVDPTTNKYVDVYELDSNGKVANFSEITLVASDITAPTFKTASIVAKGSAAGTTKVTLIAKTKNDTFQYVISSSPIATLPILGSTVSSGTAYISGTDITGVDPTTNKYLDIYEVSGTNIVEAFTEITLTPSKITAPAMGTNPTAAPGTVPKSTKLTLATDTCGVSFKVNVVSKVTIPPVIGATPVGKLYTSGSNITGVDATINKYVDVYELDSNGKVVNFSEITISSNDIH